MNTNGQPIQVGEEAYEITEAGEVLVGGTKVASLVKEIHRDVIGTMSAGVKSERIITDFEQGNLQMTGSVTGYGPKG